MKQYNRIFGEITTEQTVTEVDGLPQPEITPESETNPSGEK